MKYYIALVLLFLTLILMFMGAITTTSKSSINTNVVAERDYKPVHVGHFKNLLNTRSLL